MFFVHFCVTHFDIASGMPERVILFLIRFSRISSLSQFRIEQWLAFAVLSFLAWYPLEQTVCFDCFPMLPVGCPLLW